MFIFVISVPGGAPCSNIFTITVSLLPAHLNATDHYSGGKNVDIYRYTQHIYKYIYKYIYIYAQHIYCKLCNVITCHNISLFE